MADIELVIKIDEDYVKIINKNGASNYPEEVIKNGTQLPEKPVSCKFIERNGNVAPYLIVATNDVKALEQEPCDCISRKQALSDFAAWYGFGYSYNTFYEHLKNMPSIQPKTDVLDKLRAEIDSYCSDNRDRNDGLYIAMQIIDKYKAESGEE